MSLGRHLRELWQFRLGLIAAVTLATLAALWSIGQVSLFPPGVKARRLEMAAASTRVLVDTPKSAIIDLSVNTYDFQAYTNRSLLVANIMASPPVRRYIARRAHVPADVLQVASPVTPDFPRPLSSDGEKHSSDLLKSPDEYRLSIQSNPTVPVADVYAEAPTAEAAQQLANGAVDGMKDYLRDLANAQSDPGQGAGPPRAAGTREGRRHRSRDQRQGGAARLPARLRRRERGRDVPQPCAAGLERRGEQERDAGGAAPETG